MSSPENSLRVRSEHMTGVRHVLAVPWPGRGHINPVMNLCKSLVSKSDAILVTVVVTEEWLGLIESDSKPERIGFTSIPNVIPSERVRATDMAGFMEAVWTNMEAPLEQLLDRLEPPPVLIVSDTLIHWMVDVGNRRNIPVASFWTMSAAVFSVFQQYDLFQEHGHFNVDLLDKGNEVVDYIPGVAPTRLADLPVVVTDQAKPIFQGILRSFSCLSKAQYLLLSSTYELEPQAIDAIKPRFPFPVYSIGPSIPYRNETETEPEAAEPDYMEWLHQQPTNSVIYVSMGSFLSASSSQMEEIAYGLRLSGVRFFYVGRGESVSHCFRGIEEHEGIVVPWCEQLRVLRHAAVGGFWSHCGWNSIQEAVFAGVPLLAYPLAADQTLNCKVVVEDWKIGRRVREAGGEGLVGREEVKSVVEKLMDLEREEGREMREKAKELQQMCMEAIAQDQGSSKRNVDCFIKDILAHHPT